jgi:serine protease Do
LKIDGETSLPVPEWAARDELQVGQWAVALGVGFGEKEAALSAGIISATSRIGGKAVQTDANLSPANYGGPLIDIDGRLIGICVPLSPGGNEAAAGAEWYDSGIGFAVPLAPDHKIFTALVEGKTLERGFLGVQTKPVEGFKPGVEILQIIPKSGAETAKLAAKDIIASVDGTDVLDPAHLSSVMARYVAGDEIKLSVRRGEETLEITATLGKAPPPEPKKKPEINKSDPNKKPEDKKPGEEEKEKKEETKPAEKPAS